jgi:muramoyltetrapeptide carboxypeptidase
MGAELNKLNKLAHGAAVSVIAPASYAAEERLERGLKQLGEFGLTGVLGSAATKRGPAYFAGTHAERLADLHAAFAAETSAAFSVRGGYGSNYLLSGLELELISKHPKPFFAYSDLTGIQLHLLDRIGLPAFHGPMVAADFGIENGVHAASFKAALNGENYSLSAGEGLRPLRDGVAEGVLYGGCLSIIVAMLGTPFEPETEGKLLFLEDVGAKPYQLDRMLWQLRAAGKLKDVKGLIFGEMLDCVAPGDSERIGSAQGGALDEVILRCLADFDGPIAIGLRSGHVTRENVTLTLGAQARLTTAGGAATLEILEGVVSHG